MGLPASLTSNLPAGAKSETHRVSGTRHAGSHVHPAQGAFAIRTYSLPELWHLLSLDAPTVAATWSWFVARCAGVHLPWVCAASLFGAVWILYSVDRLLDCRPLSCGCAPDGLEERHYFHAHHRRAFTAVIGGVALLLVLMLPALGLATLHLYLLLSVALAAWLLLLYTRHPSGQSHSLPKEFVVGPFFAAAVFIPTLARIPGAQARFIPLGLLFAAVCTLNCLLLFAWESRACPADGRPPASLRSTTSPHVVTHWAVRHLRTIILSTLASCLLAVWLFSKYSAPSQLAWFPLACAVATFLLLLLHVGRAHLRPLALRAAGDAVLLTPLLFLPWLR